MKKMTRKELEKLSGSATAGTSYIKVGMSTCGIAAGAQDVYDVLAKKSSTGMSL